MKLRFILWLSLALNLALAVSLFWKPRTATLPKSRLPAPAVVATNVETVFSSPAVSPSDAISFHWSELISDDLKIYRDHLLAFGCPRPTVRDIILGEINERFGPRRQALIAEVQTRFWDLVLRGGEQAVREEAVTPFLALKAEREQMIHDVLGVGFGSTEATMELNREFFQNTWSWLPEEKRDRLYALELKRQQELSDWTKAAGDFSQRQLTAEENQQLETIKKEFEDARNALFTPDEQEEFKLRQSNESLWASDMSGFEATPEEWKAVTRLRRDTEDAKLHLIYTDLSDQDRQKESAKLDATLAESLKQALGPERYAEYARANDEQFGTIFSVTQRYGLAKSVAVEAYDLRQSALSQAEQIRNNPDLGPDVRQKALTLLQRDTEQVLAKTLGETALLTYKEYGGEWLADLGRTGNK